MSLPTVVRFDYSFPLRIDPASRQLARVRYPQHVAQMIRQFLLTTPGERVCLPDFGGGLRRLLFSPKRIGVGSRSEMQSTTELLIRQGLDKYLGQHIEVIRVAVSSVDDIADSAIQVLVEYKLRETQSSETLMLQMG